MFFSFDPDKKGKFALYTISSVCVCWGSSLALCVCVGGKVKKPNRYPANPTRPTMSYQTPFPNDPSRPGATT